MTIRDPDIDRPIDTPVITERASVAWMPTFASGGRCVQMYFERTVPNTMLTNAALACENPVFNGMVLLVYFTFE